MSRCLYNSSFEEFISVKASAVFGELCEKYHGEALTTTREAWIEEISIMKNVISQYCDKEGKIIFEYDIPRLGKRIDVVLLLEGIIFCLEFKVGQSKVLESDIDQVLDYALDLKNFHKFSQDNVIVPILVATEYNSASANIQMSVYDDRVVNPLVTGKYGIVSLIDAVLKRFPNEEVVNPNWVISPYAPTPTIIEAIINGRDTSSRVVCAIRESKNRVFDTKIQKSLKKLYEFRCQICGATAMEAYGVDVSEAHHIEMFSLTANNDARNIMIVCPDHHRIIHKAKPIFNAELKCFDYSNGKSEQLMFNIHL